MGDSLLKEKDGIIIDINDNKIGIGIYTAKDIKLIKANQKYLDYLPKPFNTKEVSYGKCIHEFMPHIEENRLVNALNIEFSDIYL
jgi:hypothetical protein